MPPRSHRRGGVFIFAKGFGFALALGRTLYALTLPTGNGALRKPHRPQPLGQLRSQLLSRQPLDRTDRTRTTTTTGGRRRRTMMRSRVTAATTRGSALGRRSRARRGTMRRAASTTTSRAVTLLTMLLMLRMLPILLHLNTGAPEPGVFRRPWKLTRHLYTRSS